MQKSRIALGAFLSVALIGTAVAVAVAPVADSPSDSLEMNADSSQASVDVKFLSDWEFTRDRSQRCSEGSPGGF